MSVKISTLEMDVLSWKVERASPTFGDFDVKTDDTWLFDDDDVAEQLYHVKNESVDIPSPANRAEVASKLLEDLNDWIKEEPFPEWMEEKGDLGIFENLPLETSDLAITEAVKKLPVERRVEVSDTSSLLLEFQSIYDQIEQEIASLTPPLSPTLPSYANVYNVSNGFVINTPQHLTPVQVIQVAPVVPVTHAVKEEQQVVVPVAFAEKKLEESHLPSYEQIVPATPADLAHEMTVVDELVRMCADEMVPNVETGNILGGPWPESEEVSPVSNDTESDTEVLYNYPLSPGNTSSSSSGDEDPDYSPAIIPRTSVISKINRGKKRSAKDCNFSAPDDKKLRKKEQNKNAATRYRKKKKAEIEEVLGEEKELEVKNEELTKQVDDLSREIRYLKGFIRDVFKAKGLMQ